MTADQNTPDDVPSKVPGNKPPRKFNRKWLRFAILMAVLLVAVSIYLYQKYGKADRTQTARGPTNTGVQYSTPTQSSFEKSVEDIVYVQEETDSEKLLHKEIKWMKSLDDQYHEHKSSDRVPDDVFDAFAKDLRHIKLRLPNMPPFQKLAERASELCAGDLTQHDPLLLMLCGQAAFLHDDFETANERYRIAQMNFRKSHYPAILVVINNLGRCQSIRNLLDVGEYENACYDLSVAATYWMTKDFRASPAQHRFAWQKFRDCLSHLRYNHVMGFQEMHETVVASENVPPWIQEMTQGVINDWAAWQIRGNGYAHTVKPENWEPFHELSRKSGKHFRNAFEINPYFPEAASELIDTAGAGNDDESEEVWFERALKAQVDYRYAYTKRLWYARPRWGGSHEEMMEVATQALETNRFDTEAPYYLLTTLQQIADDKEEPHFYLKDKKYYELFKKYFQGNEAEPIRADGIRTLRPHAWTKSQHAFIAQQFGDYEESRLLFEELGNDFEPEALQVWKVEMSNQRAKTFALTGKNKEAARKCEEFSQPDARKSRRFHKEWREVLDEVLAGEIDPYEQIYWRTMDEVLSIEEAYDRGETVSLKFKMKSLGWKRTWGGIWDVENEDSIIGSSDRDETNMYLQHRASFDGPRIVTLDVEVLRLSPYNAPMTIGFRNDEINEGNAFELNTTSYPAMQEPDAASRKYSFTIRLGNKRDERICNGKCVSRSVVDEIDEQLEPHLGIGKLPGVRAVCRVRFSNVKVRKWDAPPLNASPEETISYYDKVLKQNPQDSIALAERGEAKFLLGDNAGALDDLMACGRADPDYPAIHFTIGNVYAEVGDWARAQERYAFSHKRSEFGGTLRVVWMQAVCPVDKFREGKNAIKNLQQMKRSLTANKGVKDPANLKWRGDHPRLASMMVLDSFAHAEIGKFERAIELLEGAMKRFDRKEDLPIYEKHLEKLKKREPIRYVPGVDTKFRFLPAGSDLNLVPKGFFPDGLPPGVLELEDL